MPLKSPLILNTGAREVAPMASMSSAQLVHPKYRSDIDGLRAIAVLCVVFFHAFPDSLKGGFTGVDVFFVISGYLISTIIFESLAGNTFRFAEFYSRRIKRIFPALLLVFLATCALGWFAMYPEEYRLLGKHVASGAGFISNFVLWKESGYFDSDSHAKPLLHLWSLGIEEQFYIVWPLLLWLAWKTRLNFLFLTAVLMVISFALNISQVRGDPVAAFYSPQTRFWELLVGAVLAHVTLHPQKTIQRLAQRIPGGAWRNLASCLGVGLLVAGLWLIAKESAFPGVWALLPTVGTVLLISAGPQAWLNRVVLSHRLLVAIGLISFPLYLWHWPLLSFAHIITDGRPSPPLVVGAVMAAFVLAALTYLWLEKPVRHGKMPRFSTLAMVLAMATVGTLGYRIKLPHSWLVSPGPSLKVVNQGDIGHDTFHAYKNQLKNLCAQYLQSPQACFKTDRITLEKLAVVGDSHADHLTIGLASQLPDRNIVFFDALGLPLFSSREGAALLKTIMADPHIKTVLLSASWYARLSAIPPASTLEAELTQVVTALTVAGKRVFIVDDVPNFSFLPQNCRYEGRWLRASKCRDERDFYFRQHRQYFPVFETVQKKTSLEIIRISDYLCSQDFCSMERNGQLLYRDNNHLNLNGSQFVAQKMLQDHPLMMNPVQPFDALRAPHEP